ncbi:MAG TPA: DUF6788 family protein, partial [Candidatus Saccharimonadales bacterium]|nr:DUF6788 family protein [Candidatus Saccharimonadales bacterium]
TSRKASRVLKTNNQDLSHKIEPLPGAVVAQYMRCGKPNCKCLQGKRHGPYFVRFWYEGRQRRKKYVKKGEVLAVYQACAAHKLQKQSFRQLLKSELQILRTMKRLLTEYGL